MATSFVGRQVAQIRAGGLRVVWRKIREFPRWLRTNVVFPQWQPAKECALKLCYYGCRLALFLKPNWAGAYNKLGNIFIQLGRTREAIEFWCKAVTASPDLVDVHVKIAIAHIKMGSWGEGFTYWQKAFSLKPDWMEAHSAIQNAFYLHGQMWAAQDIYQRIVDAQSDFAKVHQLDRLGIRFLKEYPTAIGHIGLLDNYVKRRTLCRWFPGHPIVWFHPDRISNPCYLSYWQRYLPDMVTDPVASDLLLPFAKYIEDHLNVGLDPMGAQIVDYTVAQQASIQVQWEEEDRGHLLFLTPSDRERGWCCLQTLGVPSDAWFVSLHVREGQNRSRAARDADISTYRTAIESIVARGGWVIRMGDSSMTPLPPMPQVIDYVHTLVHSDWMDVFLWAQCRFFIGTTSGAAFVSPTFGVPCVLTNWFPVLYRRWFGQDLFIPKLHWSLSEKRYLSFSEVLTSSVGFAESLDYLDSAGVHLVDNTAEEINDVVIEMLDRLEGKLQFSEADEQLRKQFETMWIRNAYKANGQIGREFLRKWAPLI